MTTSEDPLHALRCFVNYVKVGISESALEVPSIPITSDFY